eukprot:GHVL01024733.1.p1 GENE.GHVL01024733.1~~GHVL01024733.1.p1  ORF type:complete len:100 (-),score=3.62 GHVL01024733.1:9-308(-)
MIPVRNELRTNRSRFVHFDAARLCICPTVFVMILYYLYVITQWFNDTKRRSLRGCVRDIGVHETSHIIVEGFEVELQCDTGFTLSRCCCIIIIGKVQLK